MQALVSLTHMKPIRCLRTSTGADGIDQSDTLQSSTRTVMPQYVYKLLAEAELKKRVCGGGLKRKEAGALRT